MPNRIIKESICTSDTIEQLSWFEEVLFYRLIVNCDDYGRFDGRIIVIKNRLFPLRNNITAKSIENAINKLVSVGLVCCYMANGKPFLYLPTWNEHQNVRAKRSKYPEPSEETDENNLHTSDCKCMQMYANVPVIQSNPIQSNPYPYPNREYEKNKNTQFKPPTLQEVEEYCKSRNNIIDPNRFVDFYTSNGWKVGRNSMKDWRAAVRSWERREKNTHKNPKNRDYSKKGSKFADVEEDLL